MGICIYEAGVLFGQMYDMCMYSETNGFNTHTQDKSVYVIMRSSMYQYTYVLDAHTSAGINQRNKKY
jgi:hypothetical protein